MDYNLNGIIYRARKSSRKHKKYYVNYKGHAIHFGDDRFSNYLEEKDEKKRESFLKRFGTMKNKKGVFLKDDPMSPLFWSWRLLWNGENNNI